MDRCQVRYFVGHGAPGTPAERIERCPAAAVARFRAGPHLWLVGDMPREFDACRFHARVLAARHRRGLTGGEEHPALSCPACGEPILLNEITEDGLCPACEAIERRE